MKKLLFIAWDGQSPHYMQGLFLPIMSGLQDKGYEVSILQLSSIDQLSVDGLSAMAHDYQLIYDHIRIERNVFGFLKALRRGVRFVKQYMKVNRGAILMPRSLMPCAILKVAGMGNQLIVYDADGLKLEERVDFAGWSKTEVRYKLFRKLEKWAYQKAAIILTRSHRAKEVMLNDYPSLKEKTIAKVINGKDTTVFKPLDFKERKERRSALGITGDNLLAVYCGTIAPQYCLNQMMTWFGWLRVAEPGSKFLILTSDTEKVKEHHAFKVLGNDIILTTVTASEVPLWIGLADVAFAFRLSSHSMKGVAPIKIGEYLLCGLPVLASKGIGDSEDDLSPLKYSFVINEQSESALKASFKSFLKQRKESCLVPLHESVKRGVERYSIEAALDSYSQALKRIRVDER